MNRSHVMSKLRLTEWAAVSEIIGTVAVVISLIFLAFSVNKNTAVMQASNDNFVYELQFARVRDIVSSPGMASIYVKLNQNKELSAEEQERFYWDKVQELGTWEVTFIRYRDGVFSTEQWEGWNNYFIASLTNQFSAESWAEVRKWYANDFRSHVDAVYASK
jgi:hypothetical protein